MINRIYIDNYKCIEREDLEIKPLTIITGLNSTGKSTLLQSILLAEQYDVNNIDLSTKYDVIRCKYTNRNEVCIRTYWDDVQKEFIVKENDIRVPDSTNNINYATSDRLYYLSANRIGSEDVVKLFDTHTIGSRGERIFSTFEQEKMSIVDENLRRYKESYTLQHQVDYWLSYILGINLRLRTDKISEENISIKYESDGLQNILPKNLGTGVSYLVKVLIICLRAKQGDVLLIENPEIHLHPSAQAKLGEFLSFIANAGIQVIVETHCEHLINRVQYAIYKKEIAFKSVLLLYKSGIIDKFKQISFNSDGKYAVAFPEGFFDATLNELMEME